MQRQFRQVDVFTEEPFAGNPVAVVHGADGLSDEEMRLFARWTNLSETTFLLPPTDERADYRLRIFTPTRELPFAGHPTLGSAHAWLEAGGAPASGDVIVQECAVGLVPLRRTPAGLAFKAPPTARGGPVDEPTLHEIAAVLRLHREEIIDAQWTDNGPGWASVELASAKAVLELKPGVTHLDIGVFGRHPARLARGLGGPRLLPLRLRHHRRPGDRLAQRRSGAMAAGQRQGHRPLYRRPGHRPRPPRPRARERRPRRHRLDRRRHPHPYLRRRSALKEC